MEYSVQTFTYNGKKIKTVFCGGLPDTVATDALLRIAQGRVSVGALPYYAKNFLTALAETGISSLSGVTCADIRFFADTFLSDASAGVVKQYAAVINGIFDSFVELIDCHITGDPFYRTADIVRVQLFGGLTDNVAHSVTDKHLNGSFRIFIFLIAEVDNGPGYSVSHLVRMARIHFFVHSYKPFL